MAELAKLRARRYIWHIEGTVEVSVGYKIDVLNNTVVVHFSGTVDALDIIQLLGSDRHRESVRHHKRVIYNYSDATDNQLDVKEIEKFALLAKIEASMVDDVQLAIIPSGPESRERAEHYKAQLKGTSWTLYIVESFEQAMALVSNKEK